MPSPPGSPRTLISTLTHKLHSGTGEICRDFSDKGREVHSEPNPWRAWARLVVLLVVAAMALWAVIYIAKHTDSVQVNKVKKAPLQYAKAKFPALPPGSILNAPQQPNPNIICPCNSIPATYPWCKFINFSLIVCNKETNNAPKVIMISTTMDDSCKHPPNLDSLCQDFEAGSNAQDGCKFAINYALDFIQSFQMSQIYTPDLSTPLDVHSSVAQRMIANIDTLNNTAQVSTAKNQTLDVLTPGVSYNDTMLALLLLQSMVLQVFDCKTDSTPQEFWDRGITSGWSIYPQAEGHMRGSRFVFGMSVDYEAYSNKCQPSYCYSFDKEGLSKRFINAFSQVGGAASLIIFGIHFILWPLIALIFFKHPKPSPGELDGSATGGFAHLLNQICGN